MALSCRRAFMRVQTDGRAWPTICLKQMLFVRAVIRSQQMFVPQMQRKLLQKASHDNCSDVICKTVKQVIKASMLLGVSTKMLHIICHPRSRGSKARLSACQQMHLTGTDVSHILTSGLGSFSRNGTCLVALRPLTMLFLASIPVYICPSTHSLSPPLDALIMSSEVSVMSTLVQKIELNDPLTGRCVDVNQKETFDGGIIYSSL